MSKKHFISGIFVSAFWSLMVFPLKNIEDYSSFLILYGRVFYAFIASILFLFLFYFKEIKKTINLFNGIKKKIKIHTFLLIFFSSIFLSINWILYIYIVNKVNVKSASLVYAVNPMITALAGFIIMKDKINKYKVVSLIFSVIAFIILGYSQFKNILLVLSCAIAYSAFIILQKNYKIKINYLIMFSLYIFFSLIILIIIDLNTFLEAVKIRDVNFIFNVSLISVFFTFFAMVINIYSIQGLPASTSAIIIYVNPICAFLISKFYFNEIGDNVENLAYLLIAMTIISFNWKELNKLIGK